MGKKKRKTTTIPTMPYYVVMTDKFMSGWGMAKGKTNKFVIGCRTYQQAANIAHKARQRPEMRYVNIRSTKPYYDKKYYKVSYSPASKIRW